jgi:hypothetical protein
MLVCALIRLGLEVNEINTFICKCGKKSWNATITLINSHCSIYEIIIQSHSSIKVILGKTSTGHFACMPDFNAGCHLSQLNDLFRNTERLSISLGRIDGITVATALLFLADKIGYPEF